MRTAYPGTFTRFLLLAAVLQAACAQQPPGEAAWPAGSAYYRFDQPDLELELDNDLDEISGLTVLNDRHLGAVQDEDGDLFILDMQTGEVVDDPRFSGDGDYEGVELVGNRLFVLRSDGALLVIDPYPADDLDAEKIETPLSTKYDTEGLAYDASRNRLLIACKEYAGKGLENQRAIYAFDLATMTFVEEPVYTLSAHDFNDSVADTNPLDDAVRSALEPLTDLSGFKPSAIAVHPITGEVYVLSSVRTALVALDGESGRVTAVWVLPEKYFRQPEGLAFLPNGDLFISNETKNGLDATLLRFNYHPDATGR